MQSITQIILARAEVLRELFGKLLLHHSKLTPTYNKNDPNSYVLVITTAGDHKYSKLTNEGYQLQSRLIEEYKRFSDLLRLLLSNQASDTNRAFRESDLVVRETIAQDTTWYKSTTEAFQAVSAALDTQISLLSRLYDESAGEVIFIPDTNALLYAPDLEQWEFPEIKHFALVLTPVVLSELDLHKMNHKNPEVREKAEKLIRKFKEYRRRGSLINGVPLLKGRSRILALAKEPVIKHTLPWLDLNNNDDRFLATALSVMIKCPRSPSLIITRDINLQNKSEFAGVPFIEPPEDTMSPEPLMGCV